MAPRKQDQTGDENGAGESVSTDLVVPEGWASVIFDRAFQLSEEYSANLKARKANREALRGLAAQGLLSEDELTMLEELYPEREIRRRTDEERAADFEAQAQAVRDRAAKRAEEQAAKEAEANQTTAAE